MQTLKDRLLREPVALQFGTSGRRGLLLDLTQLEVYLNARAELSYLQSLPRSEGGISLSDTVYYAHDLRPSSTQRVDLPPVRGELAQAIERAIRDAGMQAVNLGAIPTPALTAYALAHDRASIMVTGSHIPFDRNGYKLNTSVGELLKQHEAPIAERVAALRQALYAEAYEDSPFDAHGLLKSGSAELMPSSDAAARAYVARYVNFFGTDALHGLRLLVYQHSAVGRDLLIQILRACGAEVFSAGRSETFVPIDTENIDAQQLAAMQALFDAAVAKHGPLHGLVSTDGDSDRPLLLGAETGRSKLHFFGGDLVGMITAGYLNADAAVVPISCNDGIDRGSLKPIVEPKTRIGSPYVIAGMQAARSRGKSAVCGWEANGGFLTASDFQRQDRVLPALPTRDAVLPILATLCASREASLNLPELFARLPARFSRAALLKAFPRPVGLAIVRAFSPEAADTREVRFQADGTIGIGVDGNALRPASDAECAELDAIRRNLSRFFDAEAGFGPITALNFVDGVRIGFSSGEIAHLRPSGNADELRVYAVADAQSRADEIVSMAVREGNGILRRIEAWIETV